MLQIQLDEKAAECENLMKKLERQNERKEELKQLLEEKEVELDDIKNAHRWYINVTIILWDHCMQHCSEVILACY